MAVMEEMLKGLLRDLNTLVETNRSASQLLMLGIYLFENG